MYLEQILKKLFSRKKIAILKLENYFFFQTGPCFPSLAMNLSFTVPLHFRNI